MRKRDGLLVKKRFSDPRRADGKQFTELMWILVEGVGQNKFEEGIFFGRLNNTPAVLTSVKFGDQVTCTWGEVIAFDTCCLDDLDENGVRKNREEEPSA